MFDVSAYMNALITSLQEAFGDRLIYVGLQGSYLRGEAGEDSDIDPMVVIDELCVHDLNVYRSIVETLPEPQKSCGFLCGRSELAHWPPLEICHALHTTQDWYGTLAELTPDWSETDLRRFLQMGVGNLYHELLHRYLHADSQKNQSLLPGTCKGLFYLLQNLHYLRTGHFAPTHADLLEKLTGEDRAVLQMAVSMRRGEAYDFDRAFEALLCWCQHTLAAL